MKSLLSRNQNTLKLLCSYLVVALTSGVAIGVNAATPTSYFQSSVITGSNNQISVQRVPVTDVNGKVTYKNVTIDFTVSATGTLLDNPALITAAPSLVTNGFVQGKYKDTHGYVYALSGPSVVPGTSRTAWSLTLVAAPTGIKMPNFSMNWITGPIAGHPIESVLTHNKIVSTAYSWGLMGTNSFAMYEAFSDWYGHSVIGANQAGNQLVLHLYYYNDANNLEDGSVSLTYCPTC
jgi:hypothetical protein